VGQAFSFWFSSSPPRYDPSVVSVGLFDVRLRSLPAHPCDEFFEHATAGVAFNVAAFLTLLGVSDGDHCNSPEALRFSIASSPLAYSARVRFEFRAISSFKGLSFTCEGDGSLAPPTALRLTGAL
jgi:hypothetical protein